MMTIRKIVLLCMILVCQRFVLGQEAVSNLTGRPSEGKGPDTVWFVFYVIDIGAIDGPGQNFTVNFFVRLRWKDERLAHGGDSVRLMPLESIWNPAVLLTNQQGLVRTSLPESAKVAPDGTVTYGQRYVGTLSQPLDLSEFPFDIHDFNIQFTSTAAPEEVVFLPDSLPGNEQVKGGLIAEKLSLPDWHILRYGAESRPLVIIEGLEAPGFSFVFTAKRYLSYYFWQTVVPLVLIVMMSWGPFWIDPSLSGTQISLAASSMLTTIAYRFLLANLLPKLPYLTRMDYFSMLSTVLVFAALMEVITTSALSHANRGQLARKIDRLARVMFPILFLLAFYWSFFV